MTRESSHTHARTTARTPAPPSRQAHLQATHQCASVPADLSACPALAARDLHIRAPRPAGLPPPGTRAGPRPVARSRRRTCATTYSAARVQGTWPDSVLAMLTDGLMCAPLAVRVQGGGKPSSALAALHGHCDRVGTRLHTCRLALLLSPAGGLPLWAKLGRTSAAAHLANADMNTAQGASSGQAGALIMGGVQECGQRAAPHAQSARLIGSTGVLPSAFS